MLTHAKDTPTEAIRNNSRARVETSLRSEFMAIHLELTILYIIIIFAIAWCQLKFILHVFVVEITISIL